jgi:hypothetical protein
MKKLWSWSCGSLVAAVIMLLILTNCSMFNTDAGWRGYVAATEELATLAQTYNQRFEEASPTAQARWIEEIDPLFIRAETALKTWRLALDVKENPRTQMEVFMQIRRLILINLFEVTEG